MQVTLTRDDLSIPWGFRLKGGAEYSVPLSILKVNEGSPAYMKLDVGDTILCIGTIHASTLKHEEALNIFRMFDYNLPLTIIKERSPMAPAQNKPSPLVWRPPSVSAAQESVYSPSHQYKPQSPYGAAQENIYSPSHQFKPQPQPQQVYKPSVSSFPSQDMSSPISIDYASYQSTYKPQVMSPPPLQHNFNNNNNNLLMRTPGSPSFSHEPPSGMRPMSPLAMSPKPLYEPPPPPAPPLPPPPLPGSGLSPLYNYKKGPETPTSSSFPSSAGHARAPSESSGEIPNALLKAMNFSPMGKKPFTYTPGGLDLSHVRNSARVKRHDSARTHEDDRNRAFVTNSFEKPNTGYMTPNLVGASYENPAMHKPHEPMYVSQTNLASQVGFRDSAPSPSFGDHFGGPMNPGSGSGGGARMYGTMPRNFREQKSSVSSFNPEEIKMAPKRSSESRDMSNQSFSFRMLNKWIENSESSQPSAQQAEEPKKVSEVKKALEDEESVRRSPQVHAPQPPQMPIYNRVAPSYSEYTPPQQQPAFRMAPAPVPVSQPVHFNKVTPINYVRPVKPPHHVMERKYSTESASDFGTGFGGGGGAMKPAYQPPGVPARERDQESEAPRYKGNHIPSKTFRYLQYLTETESVIQQAPKKPAPPADASAAASAENSSSSYSSPSAPATALQVSHQQSTAISSHHNNQATFLSANETASSFPTTSSEIPITRVHTVLSEPSTEMISSYVSSETPPQSQQQPQSQHEPVLHESGTEIVAATAAAESTRVSEESSKIAFENGNASSTSSLSSSHVNNSAVVFASDEPINTFVDLQSSQPLLTADAAATADSNDSILIDEQSATAADEQTGDQATEETKKINVISIDSSNDVDDLAARLARTPIAESAESPQAVAVHREDAEPPAADGVEVSEF